MKNIDPALHVRGKSEYVDDVPCLEGTLHGAVYYSTVAKGVIKDLDTKKAEQAQGVVAVFTYKDIPGVNQIGHISKDQPLLAEHSVNFIGEPIALVVADSKKNARRAVRDIVCEFDVEKCIVDPREAASLGLLHAPPMRMNYGDIESAWDKCKYIFEGTAESGGQEHFYFETQSCMAYPKEGGRVKALCSAQSPSGFQKHIADILSLEMNQVELEIRRLGGAFGGKEGCATWVCLASLAAIKLNRPVKIVLKRDEDIVTTGKRHPFTSDYKIGFDEDYHIVAYELNMYQDAGAYADLSMPVLGRAILHALNTYKVPNFKGTACCCKTNVVPHTAFRGFGVPQAVFIMGSAIYNASRKLGVPPYIIQKLNLVEENYELPYKMKLENCNARLCWDALDSKYNIEERFKKVDHFNSMNKAVKKGIYVMPVCFGISFVQTSMNQAGALIHIYKDGSVGVSTGAVEMGQGVNQKILNIVSKSFSLPLTKCKIETTNTTRVANASPTSASTGSDLNGMAALFATEKLLKRLRDFAADKLTMGLAENLEFRHSHLYMNGKKTGYTWNDVVEKAYLGRVDLTAHAFYAPHQLHWDHEKLQGQPYTYHSYGTSITEVTVDCLRGTYKIDSIEVVHDIGQSLDKGVDMGQFEGAIIQSAGYCTMENLKFSEEGECLSSVSSYKLPDIQFLPEKLEIEFLSKMKNPYAVFNSKAVGEPPFIHGLGACFAIMYALHSANPKGEMLSIPLTPEKAFMHLHG